MKFSFAFVLSLMAGATTSAFVSPVSKGNVALSRASPLSAASVDDVKPNPVIKVMAQGMNLLKPIFGAEAQLQAAVMGKIGNVDEEKVLKDIQTTINANKIVIYTYTLSPFSTEAVRLLKESGYEFKQVELGAEWFLLGGEESVARMELSKLVDSSATSLPKIFIGGNCIGGCSELGSLVESGEFETLVTQASKTGKAPKKLFSLF